MIAAEQNKVNEQKIVVLNEQIANLDKRVLALQGIINEYEAKEGNYKQIIEILESQKNDMLVQRAVFEKEILRLNKALKKQKRRTLWTAIGGVAASVATFVLVTLVNK